MSTKKIKDFLGLSGNNRSSIILESKLLSMAMPKNKQEVLLEYLDLLKNSSILKPVAYDFYINRLNYKELQNKYGLSKIQVSNKINRSTSKLFEEIGSDVYEEMLRRDITAREIEYYRKFIMKLKVRFKKQNNELTEQLLIDINEYFPKIVEENPGITQDELAIIAKKFETLSKPYLNILLNAIDDKQLGYIKYLLLTDNKELSSKDVINKEFFKRRMFLK